MRKVKLVFKILKYSLLTVISMILIFPVIYMVTNSFMSENEVVNAYSFVNGGIDNDIKSSYMKFKLIPEQVTFMQYYRVLIRKPKFILMFWNSIILTIPIILGQIFISALAGYGFAKFKFAGNKWIIFSFIIVMLLPFQVTLVPNYIALRNFQLLGTYQAVILPGIFSVFGVVLLRQFIIVIPDEYCESAKIDGAGYFKIFTNIILPQCKGGIASMAILSFIDNWNMVEQPLIFLEDSSMLPLSVYLSYINQTELGLAFACGIVYMLPTILIFLYGESYLVKGIQLTGIK